ncbi:MAG: hypothetical protein NPIRA05_19260 [Nitrospirales bacterium]|nr:MAG: hypothetical protein NPIRA05_19260 [Nitrospirales bacterium]
MQTSYVRFSETIQGKTIKATDGEIGHCVDLLFDERYWTARYLVVQTGSWLLGKKVIVPIISVEHVDPDTGEIEVKLSREKIENAPDIETDAPVSRRQEMSISDYYAHGYYWSLGHMWGTGLDPMALRNTAVPPPQERESQTDKGDPHLRSLNEVIGYQVTVKSEQIATVADAYVCPPNWYVSYLVLSTGNWLSREHSLLSPEWTQEISWINRAISIDISKQMVESAPVFTPPLTDDQRDELDEHYARKRAQLADERS